MEELAGLGEDEWRHVVGHARRALAELPQPLVTSEVARLRAVPPDRLVSGPARRRLVRAFASTPLLWKMVRERAADDAPPALAGWLRGETPEPPRKPDARRRPETENGGPASPPPEIGRQKERARAFREERDEAFRQLEGALARAEAAERRADGLAGELDDARQAARSLESQLAEAEERLRRAVDRERRRQDSVITELRNELRELRRRLEERPRAPRPPASAPQPSEAAATEGSEVTAAVPGRPTVLPPSVGTGTREEAMLLLPRGRLVLVDGYNVTRTHRDQLTLSEQRRWLLQLLASAAARRGIVPEVVFDGAEEGPGPGERVRGVRVMFSRGVPADDEIEFRVAALEPDEPVTVVTDDRELRERVRRYGADVIGTAPLLWAVG